MWYCYVFMEISSEYYENFYRPFLHKKSVMYQQDVINEKNKIIRSTIFLKIRKHWLEVSAEWSLRYQGSGNMIPEFRGNVPPSSEGLWVNSRPLRVKAELSFETSGSNYPTHTAALQNACFLDTKTGLQLTIFQCRVISRRECGMISALSSVPVFLSLSLVTEATRCLVVLRVARLGWERGVV
jgi:hypothetical protein